MNMEHASIPQLVLEAAIAALQLATFIFAKRTHKETRQISRTLRPPPVHTVFDEHFEDEDEDLTPRERRR